MAIEVIERWQGRGATTDEEGVRTLKRQWRVTTDSNATAEPAVIDAVVAADATAALYAPHPAWPWAVCRKLNAKPADGPRIWDVDGEYSSARFKASGDGSGSGGNTTAPSPAQSNQTPANERPPTIKIGTREFTKVLEYDLVEEEGEPPEPKRILNTVGDPFNPPPEVHRTAETITITFFRLPEDLNWDVRRLYRNTLNEDEVTFLGATYAPLTLRCASYDVDVVWETGEEGMQLFFQLTVQLLEDPDGWQPRILNTGRRRKVPAFPPFLPADTLTAIVDAAGQPVADPVPLTAAGVPVEPGGTYHYVDAAGYFPSDWAQIIG